MKKTSASFLAIALLAFAAAAPVRAEQAPLQWDWHVKNKYMAFYVSTDVGAMRYNDAYFLEKIVYNVEMSGKPKGYEKISVVNFNCAPGTYAYAHLKRYPLSEQEPGKARRIINPLDPASFSGFITDDNEIKPRNLNEKKMADFFNGERGDQIASGNLEAILFNYICSHSQELTGEITSLKPAPPAGFRKTGATAHSVRYVDYSSIKKGADDLLVYTAYEFYLLKSDESVTGPVLMRNGRIAGEQLFHQVHLNCNRQTMRSYPVSEADPGKALYQWTGNETGDMAIEALKDKMKLDKTKFIPARAGTAEEQEARAICSRQG